MHTAKFLYNLFGKVWDDKGIGGKGDELSTVAFPEELRENAAFQVYLADLYVDALGNERIRHDVIKEGRVILLVSINLAKDNERVW